MSHASSHPLHPRILAVLCPFLCLVPRHNHPQNENFFALGGTTLVRFAAGHGVVEPEATPDVLRLAVLRHVFSGACAAAHVPSSRPQCHYLPELIDPLRLARELCSAVIETNTKTLSSANILAICNALNLELNNADSRRLRRTVISALRSHVAGLDLCTTYEPSPVEDLMRSFESRQFSQLNTMAAHHSISYSSCDNAHRLRDKIATHLASGSCSTPSTSAIPTVRNAPGCSDVCQQFQDENLGESPDNTAIQIFFLSSLVHRASLQTLRRILSIQSVDFDPTDSLSKLRRRLRKHVKSLQKGKFVPGRNGRQTGGDASSDDSTHAHSHAGVTLPDEQHWPQILSPDQKLDLLKAFRQSTGKEALSQFTCAACHARYPEREKKELLLDSDALAILCPDSLPDTLSTYRTSGGVSTTLFPQSVVRDSEEGIVIVACRDCRRALLKHQMPPLASANNLALGSIPDELKDLTMVEEAMIARCRAKAWIVQLKQDEEEEGLPGAHRPWAQQAMRGHIITYPQHVEHIASLLPPSLEEMSQRIAVIFVGSTMPTVEWLRTKAKPLSVRADRVRAALVWLKENNPLYRDIQINDDVLARLTRDSVLPFHIQHVQPNSGADSLTSRYDGEPQSEINQQSAQAETEDIAFQNVVITDVEGRVSSNELRAAAIRHMKAGGGAVHIYHDAVPADTSKNPNLFPMIYPTLFPYGVGGFDQDRRSRLSMKRQVKHYFNLHDRRFQEHPTFLFTAFSIIQRRSILLHAKLKVEKASFQGGGRKQIATRGRLALGQTSA